jgi:hypothetical protein
MDFFGKVACLPFGLFEGHRLLAIRALCHFASL